MAHKEAVKTRLRNGQTGFGQRNAQFVERDVLAGFPQGKDVLPPLLDPARTHVSTLRLGSKAPGVTPLRLPASAELLHHHLGHQPPNRACTG